MEIPAFINAQYTDKDGFLTSAFQFYNDQLNQVLRQNLSNDGYVFPSLTTAQITTVEPSVPNGTVWFNTTLAKLQVKTATGIIETITSTP